MYEFGFGQISQRIDFASSASDIGFNSNGCCSGLLYGVLARNHPKCVSVGHSCLIGKGMGKPKSQGFVRQIQRREIHAAFPAIFFGSQIVSNHSAPIFMNACQMCKGVRVQTHGGTMMLTDLSSSYKSEIPGHTNSG